MREIKRDCCKPEVEVQVEVGIAHCRPRLYVFTHKPVLDHLEGLQYSDYLISSPSAVDAENKQTDYCN